MEITNSLEVPVSPDEAWVILLDIPRIMPCVPGAALIEVLDDKTYKGKVTVRLGPVSLSFVGTARFDELDPAAKRARVLAKGSDSKGRGGADATVLLQLYPSETGTRVEVQTNVALSGSVAQYGRGTGIIQSVATQLTNQFAQNLKAMLAHENEQDEEPEASPAVPTLEPVSQPVQASAAAAEHPAQPAPTFFAATPDPMIAAVMRTEAAATRAEAVAARVEAAVGRVEATVARAEASANALRKTAGPPAMQSKPISGISLMLTVLWGMITGPFSSRRTG
jgi:uncharacterized protein